MRKEDEMPQDGDYMTCDVGPLGSYTAVEIVGGRHIGTFQTEDEAYRCIRDRMEKIGYWPNVWHISDHGNISLVSWEELRVV